MNEVRENPFRDQGLWYWRDDKQEIHGPYCVQMDALRELIKHCTVHEGRWKKFKRAIAELVAS